MSDKEVKIFLKENYHMNTNELAELIGISQKTLKEYLERRYPSQEEVNSVKDSLTSEEIFFWKVVFQTKDDWNLNYRFCTDICGDFIKVLEIKFDEQMKIRKELGKVYDPFREHIRNNLKK